MQRVLLGLASESSCSGFSQTRNEYENKVATLIQKHNKKQSRSQTKKQKVDNSPAASPSHFVSAEIQDAHSVPVPQYSTFRVFQAVVSTLTDFVDVVAVAGKNGPWYYVGTH